MLPSGIVMCVCVRVSIPPSIHPPVHLPLLIRGLGRVGSSLSREAQTFRFGNVAISTASLHPCNSQRPLPATSQRPSPFSWHQFQKKGRGKVNLFLVNVLRLPSQNESDRSVRRHAACALTHTYLCTYFKSIPFHFFFPSSKLP